MISRADPQPRAAVIGKVNDVITFNLFNINLGGDVDRFLARITAAWIWIENLDLFYLLIKNVNIDMSVFRQMLKSMRLQVFKMISHKLSRKAFSFVIRL